VRIQITDNDGRVLYVPTLNETLERDLFALFPQYPKWRVHKNKRTKHAVKTIEAAIWQLRMNTRHAVGEPGED
jgi:hypothetical protein